MKNLKSLLSTATLIQKPLIIILILGISTDLDAQNKLLIDAVSAYFDDSFSQWTVYTNNEEIQGDIKLTYSFQNDFSKWSFSLGDHYGRIQKKGLPISEEWTLFFQGNTITLRPIWPRDPTQWRITDNQNQIFQFRRKRDFEPTWFTTSDHNGYFEIYNQYQGDLRDWIVVDELNPQISIATKMAFIFIATYYSTPKF